MAEKITSREKDYSQWYNDIIQGADLAENSGVRGCMVIKPYGYAIWERMQADQRQINAFEGAIAACDQILNAHTKADKVEIDG